MLDLESDFSVHPQNFRAFDGIFVPIPKQLKVSENGILYYEFTYLHGVAKLVPFTVNNAFTFYVLQSILTRLNDSTFSHRLTSFNGSLFRYRHLCLDNEQHHKQGTAEDCLYLNGKTRTSFYRRLMTVWSLPLSTGTQFLPQMLKRQPKAWL